MNLLAHAGFSDPGGTGTWDLLLNPFVLALLASAVCLFAVFCRFAVLAIKEVVRWYRRPVLPKTRDARL